MTRLNGINRMIPLFIGIFLVAGTVFLECRKRVIDSDIQISTEPTIAGVLLSWRDEKAHLVRVLMGRKAYGAFGKLQELDSGKQRRHRFIVPWSTWKQARFGVVLYDDGRKRRFRRADVEKFSLKGPSIMWTKGGLVLSWQSSITIEGRLLCGGLKCPPPLERLSSKGKVHTFRLPAQAALDRKLTFCFTGWDRFGATVRSKTGTLPPAALFPLFEEAERLRRENVLDDCLDMVGKLSPIDELSEILKRTEETGTVKRCLEILQKRRRTLLSGPGLTQQEKIGLWRRLSSFIRLDLLLKSHGAPAAYGFKPSACDFINFWYSTDNATRVFRRLKGKAACTPLGGQTAELQPQNSKKEDSIHRFSFRIIRNWIDNCGGRFSLCVYASFPAPKACLLVEINDILVLPLWCPEQSGAPLCLLAELPVELLLHNENTFTVSCIAFSASSISRKALIREFFLAASGRPSWKDIASVRAVYR